ncbi:MAG: cysteine--tRNA ligase [bacterium]|nr:cysteine--tRNA ligase [bacterium]MDT8365322.1 cysteine--tRNA ligase [bacterium]
MTLRVYNTLSGKKEEFKPISPPKVGMYACGVTVYDYCHIGHARASVAFDVIARYLRFAGYDVTYVRNYTDIDDKIINRSNEQGVHWKELAETFIKAHDTDMGALGVQRADVEPRATDYMAQIIAIVKVLVDKGFAYEVEGDVYFEVEKFHGYGKLSKRNLDDLQAGARIDVDERKVNPLDFALWKSSKPGEPEWDSPWGKGRPGWHIECSAMSAEILGQPLDIHGGGKDLIFPHHENEIAQSEAAGGREFVRYWMHNGFVNIDSEKMSKSLGNFFTIREVLEKFDPDVVRFFLLSTHYRSPLDFSDDALDKARIGLNKFANLFVRMARIGQENRETNDDEKEVLDSFANDIEPSFVKSMNDDFNTAGAIGHLFKAIPLVNAMLNKADEESQVGVSKEAFETIDAFFRKVGSILGLFEDGIDWGHKFLGIQDVTVQLGVPHAKGTVLSVETSFSGTASMKTEGYVIPREVNELIAEREKAREEKNYALSDELRDKIAELGFTVQDTPQGAIAVLIKK